MQNKGRKVLLVVNKADNVILKSDEKMKEFERLGLGEPLPLSAIHADGVGDILDKVEDHHGDVTTDTLTGDRRHTARRADTGNRRDG